MFCKKCGNSLPDGAMFCKKCGNKIERRSVTEESKPAATAEQHNAALVCKKCGSSLPDNAMFCKKCGNKVDITPPVTKESKPEATHEPRLSEPQNTQQPQQTVPQYNVQQPTAPRQTAPQYTAPQYTAPMYGTPVPAAPKNPFPLKYILIPTCILATVAVLIVVLVITLKPKQPSSSGSGGLGGFQTSVGNGGGNDPGGNGGGGNIGSTGFVAGVQDFNLVNAIYSREGEYTAILFEGTYDEIAMLVIAAANGGFDNSTTYNQSNFGDKIEVIAVLLDTNTGECWTGSSATQGLSSARVLTGSNTEASVSGTLITSEYGEIPFSASSSLTNVSMDSIRNKIAAYDEYSPSAGNGGGNAGGGNGGGNQPMNCVGCSKHVPQKGMCPSCDGDRSCHICVDGMERCISCGGSRVCQKCGGSGLCPYCGGDGIMYN